MREKHNRNRRINFVLSEQEEALILERMKGLGIRNLSAYLRKVAIDGYIIQLDLSGISDLVSLLRRCSNNLNQLAKRANESRSLYKEDIENLQEQYGALWELAQRILSGLAQIP